MDRKDSEVMKLFTPGPVNPSRPATDALVQPILHHRSGDFRKILAGLLEGLKFVFQTGDEVTALTSSGTGAMEAVVANLFSPGDDVLVPVSGKFSRRWAEICEAFGVNVTSIDLLPGESPTAERISESIRRNQRISGVLLTHCETSTGGLTDLRSVCEAITDLGRVNGRRILTCADCIASLCVDELRKDRWGIDCVIGASQKGLLAPPGLAFVCLNSEAMERISRSGSPRYYFDLRKYYGLEAEAPFTPAVSLICAVKSSLDYILRLGLERVWEANQSAASGIRLIIEAAGFRPLAVNQSNVVMAFWVEDLDANEIARVLRQEHGIVIAHGQGDLRGKVLRVSAIGKARSEILAFAAAFAAAMNRLGRGFSLDTIQDRLEHVLEGSRLWESQQS